MIRCKLIEVEQGSAEWRELRRGRITASRMGDVLANKNTRRYIDYRMQLALELLGHKEDEEQARWMLHGKQMEPHIREAYAKKFDRQVTADVFCISEKYDWLGCSPDGLVLPDYDMAIEIKAREKMSTYEQVMEKQRRLGKIDSNYRPQVAAQAWVMGLPSIEYCEGWADLGRQKVRLHVKTVPIDQKLVEMMEIRCLQLMVEVWQLASRVGNNRGRRLAGAFRRSNTSNLPDAGTIRMRPASNGFDSLCQSSIRLWPGTAHRQPEALKSMAG